jgi:hypothetical protein
MRVETDAGEVIELGSTETTPTIGIIDYSKRVTDDFGVTTIVERGFARRMSVRLAVPFGNVDALQRRLATLRAKAALWVADDRYGSLKISGFYKDFSLDLATPPISYCTLTIEGLMEIDALVDGGGDPAPAGQASTLQLLQPIPIAGTALVSSNVPETDYAEWAAATTYALGARVIRASTHRVYESAIAGNKGDDPVSASGKWFEVGATNRWAMFDQALGSVTRSTGGIVVTLNVGLVDAVALLDVKAATVRVQAPGYDRTLPAGTGAVTFLDLPPTSANVIVSIGGVGEVSLGTLLVGRRVALGITEASPTAGITDYSRKDVDEFGDATIVERAWAKRMTAKALIRTDAIDAVAHRIAAVRAMPSLWIGQTGLDSLTIYGFFKDFSIEVGETLSKLALSVEGLSVAAKVEPLKAVVEWSDVRDTDDKKPDDNATNSADPKSPFGNSTVGEVLGASAKANKDIDDLVATFGTTQSANASASAAAVASTASQAARDQSVAARDAAAAAEQDAGNYAGQALQSQSLADQARALAQTASGQAGTARDAATTARDTATQKATDAAQSATSAGGSASTASGQATIATQKADAAGQAASTATAKADIATTKAGEASNSASSAATSEQSALGSKNSAATSAAVAASTYQSLLQVTGDDAFDNGLDGWVQVPGAPAGVLALIATGTGRANVLSAGNFVSASYVSKKRYPVTSADQKFALSGAFRKSGGLDSGSSIYVGFMSYDAAGARIEGDGLGNYPLAFNEQLPSGAWVDRNVTISKAFASNIYSPYPGALGRGGRVAIPAGAVSIAPVFFLNFAGGNEAYQIDYLSLRDVTSELAAAGSASAAATSASNAATSKVGADQSASAAQIAKTDAQTAAGQAGTSATSAATSETNALGSKNAAASSATVSASSAKAAAQAADFPLTFAQKGALFANGTWGNGSTLLDADFVVGPSGFTYVKSGSFNVTYARAIPGNNRLLRYQARIRAVGASATYSADYEWSANQSGVQGGTFNGFSTLTVAMGWQNIDYLLDGRAGNTANFVWPQLRGTAGAGGTVEIEYFRVVDITDQRAASDSASAAASSASTAGTKADAAGQSASSAQTSATTAATKAGEASTSASNASTSETNALGSKNAASASATVAATSQNAAVAAAARTLPPDFADEGMFWTNSINAPYLALNGSFAVVAGEGKVWQTPSLATEQHIFSRSMLPVLPGNTYRMSSRVRMVAQGTNGQNGQWYPQLLGYDASGNLNTGINTAAGTQATYPALNVWTTLVTEYTAPATPPAPYVKASVGFNGFNNSNAVFQVARIELVNVTAQKTADASATAASGSASSASTSATAAGQSATAAEGFKNQAQTAAGSADASRSSAATSETNALGSKNAAASSATVSATARDGSQQAAAITFPSDFQQDDVFWTNDYTHLPGSGMPWGTFVTVAGIGRVFQTSGNPGLIVIAPKGYVRAVPGRTYRCTSIARVIRDATNGAPAAGYNHALYGYNDVGNATGWYSVWSVRNPTVASGWLTIIDEGTMPDNGTTFVRPLFVTNNNNSDAQWQVRSVLWEDITDSKAAAQSASAAATSASTAAASNTAAGQSASASETARQNATTAKASAEAARDSSVTARNDAQGAAAAAASSASVASQYANQNSGRIEEVNTTLSNQLGSLSQRTTSTEAKAGALDSRTSIVEQAVASSATKAAAARLELSATSPGGRASVTIRSDSNNGAGIDIVGDTRFMGKLLVGGTTGKRVQIEENKIVIDNGFVMRASGTGFGTQNQFIEWVGPSRDLALCNEADATSYITTNGSAYFGGALSAGVLKNAVQTTAVDLGANVTTGSFGSNGRPRTVTVSFFFSRSGSNTGSCPTSPVVPSATVALHRGTDASGPVLSTQTFPGSFDCEPGRPNEPGFISEQIAASFTFTDTAGGTTASYFARLVSRSTNTSPQRQSLGIVSTEQ